jgi:hypothetical protein
MLTQDTFKGQMLHFSRYKRASDHKGKKVVVVGACTSGLNKLLYPECGLIFVLHAGHDIAMDCYDHGVGVFPLPLFHCSSDLMLNDRCDNVPAQLDVRHDQHERAEDRLGRCDILVHFFSILSLRIAPIRPIFRRCAPNRHLRPA